MPRRSGGTKKTVSEMMQNPAELCKDWKEMNKKRIGKFYKSKKECVDLVKKINKLFKTVKQHKSNGGTRRRF